MSKKKEKSKNGKKKGGKAKLKAPDKKALKQAAIDLAIIHAATIWWVDPTDPQSISDLRAAVERLTVERLPLASRPASRDDEPIHVDFSTVMVTRTFITRVYNDYSMTTAQKIALTRVINEVMATVARARMSPATPSPILDKARLQSAKSQEVGVDLATLDKVALNQDAVEEVRLFGSIGPAGLQHLKEFVACAKELVLADARPASAS